MAVESLECCLSRAMGSSCTGETKTYSSEEPGCPLWPAGWTVQGCLVSCSCSVPNPNQQSHPHWLRTHHRALLCSPSDFQKDF